MKNAKCAACGHEITPFPDVPADMLGEFCVPLRNRKRTRNAGGSL